MIVTESPPREYSRSSYLSLSIYLSHSLILSGYYPLSVARLDHLSLSPSVSLSNSRLIVATIRSLSLSVSHFLSFYVDFKSPLLSIQMIHSLSPPLH